MEFDDIILTLYFSNDRNKIQSIIDRAFHREDRFSFFSGDNSVEAIHTGIYFESQHKKLMELVYCLRTKELIYQHYMGEKVDFTSSPLGEVMHWCLTQYNGDDYGHFVPYYDSVSYPYFKYCPYYDVNLRTFAQSYQVFSIYIRTTNPDFELKGRGFIKIGRKYIGSYKIGRHRN